jgi:hypothetical protein
MIMTRLAVAKCPLILRYHRLMDAFAKSDDERDFYLDKIEGFLVYADLDKGEEELKAVEEEFAKNRDRYALIPKMTFFEIKKFMEGFIQEKVYDIDTKEKLLDIISAKDPRENFLEFIYDNLTELEKWQLYYQERFRIRIIEWLRSLAIKFVFEEDLDMPRGLMEKVKKTLFEDKVPKEIAAAREALFSKAKTYYSNEALNPRPKRGRPPKQAAKITIEPQFTIDLYSTVPSALRLFLYVPDITSASSVTFSAKFETEEHLLASLRGSSRMKIDEKLEALSQRLESLQNLSNRLAGQEALFGAEKIRKPFVPFARPKIAEKKEISLEAPSGEKVEIAVEQILPQRKLPSKEEGVPQAPSRRYGGIKKVAPIKSNPKKKK